jgi:hypothetical protein
LTPSTRRNERPPWLQAVPLWPSDVLSLDAQLPRLPTDLLPNLPSFIRRVCSSFAPAGGVCELSWCEPVEARVRSVGVVQRGLRTPTGPFFANSCIDITPGPAAVFACMKRSRRPMVSSSAAR